MKVEAVCSCTTPGECPTVVSIDDPGLGEFFRHVQLVDVSRLQLSGRTAVDEDGGIARCEFCNCELVVLRPSRPEAKFALGHISISSGVRRMLRADEYEHAEHYTRVVDQWIRFHQRGAYGLIDEKDKRVNEAALTIDGGQAQGRIHSVFSFGGERVWVITQRGRHETTVLLPEEF